MQGVVDTNVCLFISKRTIPYVILMMDSFLLNWYLIINIHTYGIEAVLPVSQQPGLLDMDLIYWLFRCLRTNLREICIKFCWQKYIFEGY